jgi:transposase
LDVTAVVEDLHACRLKPLGQSAQRKSHLRDRHAGRLAQLGRERPVAAEAALASAFLVAHPNVRLHYTPTYSSWLNQVELWLSKIERDVIARGVFTSVTGLRRKLMRYIKQYNKTAKPVRWAYADPTRRIA